MILYHKNSEFVSPNLDHSRETSLESPFIVPSPRRGFLHLFVRTTDVNWEIQDAKDLLIRPSRVQGQRRLKIIMEMWKNALKIKRESFEDKEPHLSHVGIYGDFCANSFDGGLFLVVPYVSKCLFSHAFLEDFMLHSGSMFDLSCHDFGVMNNASIESIVVGFGLDGA
ncbi:hypothetical protein M9H77_17555 [Catharanthus roseus]|uniref:Uncharacterized protein n=1 Tax=Catharanthus roseus TaxID=4058 RepID=A0ACC0B563_CATRO|nr:hypothetical protein M9H77_17555 [Catharanthus roseus]